VNKFIVEYSDPQSGDWLNVWTATNRLPKIVRITMAMGKLDQFSSAPQEEVFATLALPAQPVPTQWEMPTLGGGGPGGGGGPNIKLKPGGGGVQVSPK
jgi:hypothetical protein